MTTKKVEPPAECSKVPPLAIVSSPSKGSDGTVARVGPGDVVLAEDLTGQGHITRVVGNQPRMYAIVPLADS